MDLVRRVQYGHRRWPIINSVASYVTFYFKYSNRPTYFGIFFMNKNFKSK